MALSVLWSCSDNNTENVVGVKTVSNVTFESGAGEIIFKWDNPDISNLSYVEISFKDDKDTNRKVLVNGKLNEQRIYGLADNEEHEFKFVVYNTEGLCSDPILVNAKGDVTPFDALMNSVEASVKHTGLEIKWNNVYDGEFFVDVKFKDKSAMDRKLEVVIKEKGTGFQLVELPGVYQTEVRVSVVDIYGNQSVEDRVFNFKRLENGRLDRTIWNIVGFSTEEAGGEGPVSGYASALLDGNPTTFWHSKWKDYLDPHYPHYVTFDLGRIVNLKSAEIYRRIGNTDLNTFQIQGGPSKDGPWTKIVEYVILANNNAQAIPFTEPVKYRFIRMYCTKGGGTALHASMAEFSLFGEDLEEN